MQKARDGGIILGKMGSVQPQTRPVSLELLTTVHRPSLCFMRIVSRLALITLREEGVTKVLMCYRLIII
jgi:hypothetical protein